MFYFSRTQPIRGRTFLSVPPHLSSKRVHLYIYILSKRNERQSIKFRRKYFSSLSFIPFVLVAHFRSFAAMQCVKRAMRFHPLTYNKYYWCSARRKFFFICVGEKKKKKKQNRKTRIFPEWNSGNVQKQRGFIYPFLYI